MICSNRPRLIIADERKLIAEAFGKMLSKRYNLVSIVCDGRSLVNVTQKFRPDVVLTEIDLPLMNGLEAISRIKRNLPDTRIICVTSHGEQEIASEALRRGAAGYVLKTDDKFELEVGIQQVLRGQRYVAPSLTQKFRHFVEPRPQSDDTGEPLTERQAEVLQLLAEGNSMKQVASVLHLATRTVAFHKYRIMKSLFLKNDAEVVRYALQHHIVFNG